MRLPCLGCQTGRELPFEFTMAFQPIVDIAAGHVWGYEALVRGTGGEGAASVLARVTSDTLYKFDQACRVRAIELAGQLFPANGETVVSINFMPNAVYEPAACIRASLQAAQRVGFPGNRIMFEFTENERVMDPAHVSHIIAEYKRHGLLTALDDFGSGYAGLSLLAKLRTDVVKIDMELVRGIGNDPVRRAIVGGIVGMAREIGFKVICEGVETAAEMAAVQAAGVRLVQGYYLARPEVERLPAVRDLATELACIA